MEAMEDITILRQNFPLSRMDDSEKAPELETGVPNTDLPQSLEGAAYMSAHHPKAPRTSLV